MCFSAPAPPSLPPVDPELIAQKEAAKAAAERQLHEEKQRNLYGTVSLLRGTTGLRALTGDGGMRGYGSSLLV